MCPRVYDGPEHIEHVVTVEHDVLPGEAEHGPTVDGEQVEAPGIPAEGRPISVPLERLRLEHQLQALVYEIRTDVLARIDDPPLWLNGEASGEILRTYRPRVR